MRWHTIEPRSPPLHWRTVQLEACLINGRPRVGKLQSADFQESGEYAIVDQGQSPIAGYSDREDLAYKGELPVIVFGDHTRIFKYIDFPFICGADGVKVLVPNQKLIDPLFFYFYALTLPIPDRGYSRHYKYLREMKISLPTLPEQHHIAEILREADELRGLRYRAKQRAADLLPALFYKVFGNPITNSYDWTRKPLHRFGEVTTGNTPPRSHPEYYGDHIDWVKSDNLGSVTGDIGPTTECLSEEGAKRGRVVQQGATLVTCIAGSLESIGKAGLADRALAFNQQINAITPNPDTNPSFLFALIVMSKPLIQAKASRGMKKIVKKSRLESVMLIAPSRREQDAFAQQWLDCVAHLNLQEEAASRLDTLFNSLLAHAFIGDLTASWREAREAELAEFAAERDRLLGLHAEEPYTLDPATGRVVALNQQALTRLVAQQMESAAQQFQEALATNQFVEMAAQLAWLSLAHLVQPLAAEHAEVLSRILSESVANLHRDALADLGQVAGALAERTEASLLEAARQSINALSLALARDVAEMAAQIWATLETPSPQAERAVRGSLDPLTLSLLRAAEGQMAYFRAEDLARDGIGLVEAEEHLQLLAVLGFVRQVEIRGRLLYRTVDPIADRASPEGLET